MSIEEAQDTYKVRIVFRGLCPIVPGAEGPTPPWVGALLINASGASREEFQLESAELFPDHFPFIKYRVSNLKGMEKAPEEEVLSPLKNVDMAFVLPDGSKKGTLIQFSDHELGEVPSKEEADFFDWVTPMDRVVPGSGTVAAECFDDDPSRRLAARVHITDGVLQTHSIGQFGGQAVVTTFQLDGEVKRTAVAKSIRLTFECAPGDFSIRTRPFDDPDAHTKELVFRQPDNGDLKIEICNLCVEDLLLAQAQGVSKAEATRDDRDFKWNYLISEDVDNLLKQGVVPASFSVLPFPDPVKGKPNGGGVDGAQCSPPRSAPVANSGLINSMLDLAAGISA